MMTSLLLSSTDTDDTDDATSTCSTTNASQSSVGFLPAQDDGPPESSAWVRRVGAAAHVAGGDGVAVELGEELVQERMRRIRAERAVRLLVEKVQSEAQNRAMHADEQQQSRSAIERLAHTVEDLRRQCDELRRLARVHER